MALLGTQAALGLAPAGGLLFLAGSRGLLRAVHTSSPPRSAAGDDEQQYQQRPLSQDPGVLQAAAAAAGAERPRTVPPRCLLSSINDPENYGLGGATGNGPHYWLGHSMSPPEYRMPASLRSSSPSPLPSQGFRTARPLPNVQRVVSWRSSMADPLYHWRSSMADPPLPLKGTQPAAEEGEEKK